MGQHRPLYAQGRFVAILGAGVADSYFGDPRDMAQRLSQASNFPLGAHQQGDLPRVLQYLDVTQYRPTMIAALRKQMREELLRRHRSRMTPELQAKPMGDMIEFLTFTPRPGMFRALKAAGKNPVRLFTMWRKTKDGLPAGPDFKGTETADNPVVYQMQVVFGRDEFAPENQSLVLTENDYFDYLISVSSDASAEARSKLIPQVVRSALADNSLVFLGFQLTDWSFRVLFRLIESLEGGQKSENLKMTHVGVQVNPTSTASPT
jgi:hypothetical protein